MNTPEAYINLNCKSHNLQQELSNISLENGDFSFWICNRVAYLIKQESPKDPNINFDQVPPPVMLSEFAYSKVLQAKVGKLRNIIIDVLVVKLDWTIWFNKINANNLYLTN